MLSIIVRSMFAVILIEALGILMVGCAYVIEMYVKEIINERKSFK